MEDKTTKRPWVIDRTVITHNSPNRYWETYILSRTGYVASVQGASEEESKANARLILQTVRDFDISRGDE